MKIYRQEKIEIFFKDHSYFAVSGFVNVFSLFGKTALEFVCKNEAVCLFVVKCKF